jgi:hypothetical protein
LKSSEKAGPVGVGVGVDPEPGVEPDPGVDPDPVEPDPGVDPDPAVDADLDTEQLTLTPPFEPPQLHVQGPEPATFDDVPFEQRLVEGAEDACVPLADPHTPATTGAGAALTATVALAAEDKLRYPTQVSV